MMLIAPIICVILSGILFVQDAKDNKVSSLLVLAHFMVVYQCLIQVNFRQSMIVLAVLAALVGYYVFIVNDNQFESRIKLVDIGYLILLLSIIIEFRFTSITISQDILKYALILGFASTVFALIRGRLKNIPFLTIVLPMLSYLVFKIVQLNLVR